MGVDHRHKAENPFKEQLRKTQSDRLLGPKLLWMSLDLEKMNEWTDPQDGFEAQLNGMSGPGLEEPKHAYPYKNEGE